MYRLQVVGQSGQWAHADAVPTVSRSAGFIAPILCLCIILTLIGSGPALLTVMDLGAYLALIGMALLTFVPILSAGLAGASCDYFEPVYLFSFWFVIDYGIGPVWALFNADNPNISLEPAFLDRPIAAWSFLFATISYGSLLVGYYSGVGPRVSQWLRPLRAQWTTQRLFPKIMLVFIFGMTVKIYGYSRGIVSHGFSAGSPEEFWAYDYIQNFSRFSLYALAMIVLTGEWRRNSSTRLALAFMLVSELASATAGTSKSYVMLVVLVLVMASNYRNRLIPARHFIWLFLLCLFVIFPVMNIYKEHHYQVLGYHLDAGEQSGFMEQDLGQQLSWQTAVESSKRAFNEITEMSLGEYLVASVRMVGGRQNQINHIANVIAKTPDPFPYRLGADLPWTVLSAVIPRLVWPDKIAPQDGNIYDVDYSNSVIGAGAGPNFTADWYMNFGWVGIPLGMLFCGVLLRFVYEYLVIRTRAAPAGVFYYVFLMIPLLQTSVETPISGLATAIKLILYLTVAHGFMRL
jgi:hypothetical protein